MSACPVDSARDRLPVPLQLVGSHHPHAAAGAEAFRGQLDVAPQLEAGGDRRLVRCLVGAEPHVPVGAEHPAGAEFRGKIGEQLDHRPQHRVLVDGLVLVPVRLGIVGFEPFVEVDRVARPPAEAHRRSVARPRRPCRGRAAGGSASSGRRAPVEHGLDEELRHGRREPVGILLGDAIGEPAAYQQRRQPVHHRPGRYATTSGSRPRSLPSAPHRPMVPMSRA